MRRRPSGWTSVGETLEDWIERVGYCFHQPVCTDSAVCRAKRAQDRARTTPQPRVYTGQAPTPRKLDWNDE